MQTVLLPQNAAPRSRARNHPRRFEQITTPLNEIARHSASLVACQAGRFELNGQRHELPRYLFIGPSGGAEPLRLGIFAGIHGDEPAGSFAVLRLVQLLEANPEMARGYCLFLYPVCNPTGFEDCTRHNRAAKDLNREFWQNSTESEVRLLETELWSHAFDGIISLHTDDTSNGVYGYAHGAVLTENLLRPALAAAAEFWPLNQNAVIDGFRAGNGIIRGSFDGVLRAPPGVRPRPFEVIFETPHIAPQYLQEAALVVALQTVLDEYRKLRSYAQSI